LYEYLNSFLELSFSVANNWYTRFEQLEQRTHHTFMMYNCTPVTKGWIETNEGYKFGQKVSLNCTPSFLFSLMKEPSMWKETLGLDIEWDAPFGPNTSRTVKSGSATFHEVFYEWEEDKGFGFCFDKSSISIVEKLAEDWIITPSEDGCTLEWVGAVSFKRFGFLAIVFAKVLQYKSGPAFSKLAKLVDSKK